MDLWCAKRQTVYILIGYLGVSPYHMLYCQFYYKLQKLGREWGKACNVNHVYQREYIGKCLWNFGKIWHLLLLLKMIITSSKWGYVLWYMILMHIYCTLCYKENCKERNEEEHCYCLYHVQIIDSSKSTLRTFVNHYYPFSKHFCRLFRVI